MSQIIFFLHVHYWIPRSSNFALTSFGSLFRHMATNSLNALLKFPVSSGGLFLGIKNKTRIGWRSEFGGSPLASSMAVIPRDQISA